MSGVCLDLEVVWPVLEHIRCVPAKQQIQLTVYCKCRAYLHYLRLILNSAVVEHYHVTLSVGCKHQLKGVELHTNTKSTRC